MAEPYKTRLATLSEHHSGGHLNWLVALNERFKNMWLKFVVVKTDHGKKRLYGADINNWKDRFRYSLGYWPKDDDLLEHGSEYIPQS